VEFVHRTEQFVAETGGVILQQLKAIGASADWSRTAYTLSPALSRIVREAFVRLFERGLIYRGHRVIHWCPRCLTSLSDEEAEHHEAEGKLYYIAYPLTQVHARDTPGGGIVVATTRPETMLADVAVAVNPADERYTDLVGRTVLLPLTNVEIPIIADEYSDPAFGTGAVKITPAHDANDFDVAQRHQLAMPVVIDESAVVREVMDAAGRVPESIRGLDRFDARTKIVELLRQGGFLVKTENHRLSIRRCYRCDTIVEPRLSEQWFVKMNRSRTALKAVRTHPILPSAGRRSISTGSRHSRLEYFRQLWWGHRIPIWYCDGCGR
jgi:valyl-tRNA synthetase